MTHLLAHARRNALPYLAAAVAVGLAVGGGYALAAGSTKTITVCADKKTGVLHLKTRGRCKSSQTRVSWNEQGPQGVQGQPGTAGAQGPAGAQGVQGVQGPAAVSVWANVTGSGAIAAGQGVSVQQVSPGTYQVTVTDSTCAHEINAPVVSVSDSNPPVHGAFPVAWYEATGANQQFTVFTGYVASGSFTATDHTFDILDRCP